LEVPPEEADHFRGPDFASVLRSLELFSAKISALEGGPVLGPEATKEAEPANLDLSADGRTILWWIFGRVDWVAMCDSMNHINGETLEGERGTIVFTVCTEGLDEFGAPFCDIGSGTPGVMALAVDAFAAGALGRIAGPMSFVFLRGKDLMEEFEIKYAVGTGVAGCQTKESKIDGGSSSIRPMVVGLKSGKVWRFGSGGADVASIVAGDGAIADVKMGPDRWRQRNVMACVGRMRNKRKVKIVDSE
jgi:hypothetical protein